MLEALEARFFDHSQEFCSAASLAQVQHCRHRFFLSAHFRLSQTCNILSFLEHFCQAVQSVAPPPPSRKTARAWAHPGAEDGGVIETTAAAVDAAVHSSPKVCSTRQLVLLLCCVRSLTFVSAKEALSMMAHFLSACDSVAWTK